MAKARFDIFNCQGSCIKSIDLDIPFDGDDLSVHAEYELKAIDAAGIANYVCEVCYDDAYRAKFAGWIKSVDFASGGRERAF